MKGPFTCLRCGDTWPTDPRLGVACPDCGAAVGVGCIRPSGHRGNAITPHKARRTLAFARHPCRCLARFEAWLKDHPKESTHAPV